MGNIKNVPKEIRDTRQWTISRNTSGNLKIPAYTEYEPNGALNAEEADIQAGTKKYRGFYATRDDPYVLLDIDHIENPHDPWDEVPKTVLKLMCRHETYWEISPSGKGLRGIVKLPSVDVKRQVESKRALLVSANGGSPTDEAEAHFGSPWVTITGNALPYARNKIAVVPLKELQEVFKIKLFDDAPEEVEVLEQNPEDILETSVVPSLSEIEDTVFQLLLDKNPRIKRAYQKTFGEEYHHYSYWMKVMMALNHYARVSGKSLECLDIFDRWSAQDEEAYAGSEDVFAHWKSLDNTNDNIITYKTLFRLRNNAVLIWPIKKKPSKAQQDAGIDNIPLDTAYENMEALVEHFDFDFHWDELGASTLFDVYITGDSDIMEEHFMLRGIKRRHDKYYGVFTKDTLVAAFDIFFQKLGVLTMNHKKARELLINSLATRFNRFNFITNYINTPIDQLPRDCSENIGNAHNSSIESLFNCLSIEYHTDVELNLYRKYFLAWLLGLVRNMLYNTGVANINNSILVLTGKEQIRKTSFFRYLFPKFMQSDYVAFTTHGFNSSSNMRDVAIITRTNVLVVWDELEQHLNKETESNFKKVIDNNPQKIVLKYETNPEYIVPISIYGATSNQRKFKLGDTGSRRMFIIPVKWVDTDTMAKLCWHPIFQELIAIHKAAIAKGTTPWLLTEEELQTQLVLHSNVKVKSDYDMLLAELFDTSQELEYSDVGERKLIGIASVQTDKSGRLLTTKAISDMLDQYAPNTRIKRTALVHALERFCGKYTDTSREPKKLSIPSATITKGLIQQGPHKKWVMPPISADSKNSVIHSG